MSQCTYRKLLLPLFGVLLFAWQVDASDLKARADDLGSPTLDAFESPPFEGLVIEDDDDPFERCESNKLVYGVHLGRYAEEIAMFEEAIQSTYGIAFSTDVTQAFWGLNSYHYEFYDYNYLLFLKSFLEKARESGLQKVAVPIGDNFLNVSVIPADSKLYSDKITTLLKRDNRIYLRDNATNAFIDEIQSHPEVYLSQENLANGQERREKIKKAIGELVIELGASGYYPRSTWWTLCLHSIPHGMEDLEKSISYFHQDAILHGLLMLKQDIRNGQTPGENGAVNFVSESFSNRFTKFFGTWIFRMSGFYSVKDYYFVDTEKSYDVVSRYLAGRAGAKD